MQWQPPAQSGSMYNAPGQQQQQQQAYPNQYGQNTQNQWQPPPYQMPPSDLTPSQPAAPNKGTETRTITGEAEGIRYEILYRDVNTMVRCQLQSNASINITAGVMAGMSSNLKLEGKVKAMKLFLPGKAFSSCVSAPNGPGELLLAPPMMADVMPLHISGGNEWIVGESCFLGLTPGVSKSTKAQVSVFEWCLMQAVTGYCNSTIAQLMQM